MHSLSARREHVNLLYVKSITRVWDIGSVFAVARAYSPCLLILEDIDTLVSGGFQSYFFNEVDGLANNDGIMMIATTNHLEKLDGGLANRPSRFDRKYNFPNPDYSERVLYSEFWRKKLQDKEAVDFPKVLSPEIAKITEDFSFAYMKEAFIATLLALARAGSQDKGKDDDDINHLPFWKEMQKEVKILRDEMRAKKETAKIELPRSVDLTPEMSDRQDLQGVPKTAPLSPFDLLQRTSHPQRPEARFEATLPHRPGSIIPGYASAISSMPIPHSNSSVAAPALPSINPHPPTVEVANQSQWVNVPCHESMRNLATFGFLQRQ